MNRPRIAKQWCFLAGVGLAALLASPAGAQSTSTEQNPTRTFLTPGTHEVTLEVCNGDECATVTQTVVVLDPKPAVVSAAATPLVVEVGQLVRLTGSGSGQPPLSYSWTVSLEGSSVATLSGASAWWSTAGLPAGIYTAVLQIQNAAGTTLSVPVSITLVPSASLAFYTITPCRIFDSRAGAALPGTAWLIDVTGSGCGIPAGARAVAANVTVTQPQGMGFAVLYPGNNPQPATSTVSFSTGVTRASFAVLPLATDGTGTLAATASAGTHLILDASGYFLPIATLP